MNEIPPKTGASSSNVVLPDFVNDVAKNITEKPTQAIGQTIADIWQLTLGNRISHAVEKQRLKYAHALEEYKRELEEGISAIPKEKQVEPSLQIIGQALEDSQYCVESKELREMFAHLIANSLNSDYSNKVHPSFSRIIQQMSPLDAQMLRLFRDYRSAGGIAIANYVKKKSNSSSEPIIDWIPAQVPDDCPEEVAARSITFLQREGLIRIPEDQHFTAEIRYAPFKNSELYSELRKQSIIYGFQLDMEKGVAKLTPLGEDFISVCLD